MPRGYGGSYRMNLRPIFDPNEPTFGESLGRGISQFIANRQKKNDETDQYTNAVTDAGGTVIAPPSAMDRLRGIGSTIRQHLPGYDPQPEAEANMAAHPMARPDTTSSADDPGFQRRPQQGESGSRYGISDEIDRAVQKGPNGYEAIMPTALGRQQMATRAQIAAEARARAGKREEFGYEKGIEHKNKMEEIAATPRSSATDPAEWDRRQAIIAANAQKLKGTPGAPSTAGDLGERRLRAQTLRSAISAAQAVIPKNPFDRRQAIRDPEQKRRIEQAEAQVEAATGELNKLALPEDAPIGGGAAPAADPAAGEREHNAGAPVEVMKQRAAVVKADALKKYPKASPAAVTAYVRNVMKREGWNVQ